MHVDGPQDATRPVRRAFGRVVQSVRSGMRRSEAAQSSGQMSIARQIGGWEARCKRRRSPSPEPGPLRNAQRPLSLERSAASGRAAAPHSCIAPGHEKWTIDRPRNDGFPPSWPARSRLVPMAPAAAPRPAPPSSCSVARVDNRQTGNEPVVTGRDRARPHRTKPRRPPSDRLHRASDESGRSTAPFRGSSEPKRGRRERPLCLHSTHGAAPGEAACGANHTSRRQSRRYGPYAVPSPHSRPINPREEYPCGVASWPAR